MTCQMDIIKIRVKFILMIGKLKLLKLFQNYFTLGIEFFPFDVVISKGQKHK